MATATVKGKQSYEIMKCSDPFCFTATTNANSWNKNIYQYIGAFLQGESEWVNLFMLHIIQTEIYIIQQCQCLTFLTLFSSVMYLVCTTKSTFPTTFSPCRLTLAAESSVDFVPPSSGKSGAVGTETGSRGERALPAWPREAVFTWGFGRLAPGQDRKSSGFRTLYR